MNAQQQQSEDMHNRVPCAENTAGEFVLFQSSPQPNGLNQQPFYSDPRSKPANGADGGQGVVQSHGDFVNLLNLNNKRFSEDFNQMTPQQEHRNSLQ